MYKAEINSLLQEKAKLSQANAKLINNLSNSYQEAVDKGQQGRATFLYNLKKNVRADAVKADRALYQLISYLTSLSASTDENSNSQN